MRISFIIFVSLLFLISCQQAPPHGSSDSGEESSRRITDTLRSSSFLQDRPIEVFLPPSYYLATDRQFPVLYMMDGQNLFASELAYGGPGWGLDEVLDSLSGEESIREVIVVGIHHAGQDRFPEYMPQKPVLAFPKGIQEALGNRFSRSVYSDSFLRVIVHELKPVIDGKYRTLPGVDHTFVGGSSMGGLISMYALCEYPEIFGGAMCLSTHWPVALDASTPEASEAILDYLTAHVPLGKRWYFDHGTKELDVLYATWQLKADSILRSAGYQSGELFQSLVFDGHGHNERFWNQRLHLPLVWLLGNENAKNVSNNTFQADSLTKPMPDTERMRE